MTSALFLLIIENIFFLFLDKKFKKTIFTVYFFIMFSYCVIIAINNIFMGGYGFYKVSDQTIYLFCFVSLVFYIIGSIFFLWKGKEVKSNRRIIEKLDEKKLCRLTLFVIFILFINLIMIVIRNGIISFLLNGDENSWSSLSNHMQVVLIPLSGLLFVKFLETKRMKTLLIFLLSIMFLFLTFIKYHVISAIIATLFFTSFCYPRKIKKIGLLAILSIIVIFVMNYVLSFFAYDITADSSFYVRHLWMYIAGGVIGIDKVQMSGLSLSGYFSSMIFAFPNMITTKLFSFKFTEYIFATMVPEFNVGSTVSNVICIPGAAFLQSENMFEFSGFIIIWAILNSLAFYSARSSRNVGIVMCASVFLSFNLLSFFASFFELSLPVESMLWSLIIGFITKKKKIMVTKSSNQSIVEGLA